MKRFAIILGVLILAGTAVAGYLKFGPGPLMTAHKDAVKDAAKSRDELVAPPAVTVVKAVTADFVETVAASGSLVPRDEILVSPEIDGLRVVELLADEGDTVTKGQVLARLVSEQLDAQIAQNVASLARSDASIKQATSQIAEVGARLKEAKASFERAKPLKDSGFLSGSTFDQRESAARSLEAQLVSARDGLVAAEADKKQVEAQRRELDWRRGNTEVKSPEDGVISRRTARLGATTSGMADAMFRIIARGEIELDAEIVETELAKVKIGQDTKISVPGAGDVTGTVRLIAKEIDKSTRLGRIKIFIGANSGLRIGAYARGVIDTAKSRGLAIPAAAALFDQQGTFVQLVNGDKVEKRLIKTGLQAKDLVEVTEGLAEGDIVVARSGTFLRDGDKIRAITLGQSVSEVR